MLLTILTIICSIFLILIFNKTINQRNEWVYKHQTYLLDITSQYVQKIIINDFKKYKNLSAEYNDIYVEILGKYHHWMMRIFTHDFEKLIPNIELWNDIKKEMYGTTNIKEIINE